MKMSPSYLRWWIQLLILLSSLYNVSNAASFTDYPSINISISWLNDPFINRGYWKFSDGTHVRTILSLAKNGFPDFCFGFFNNGTPNTFYLAILKLPVKVDSTFTNYEYPPVILWSANPNDPVKENSTLEFSSRGLVLRDADGTALQLKNRITGSRNLSITHMELIPGGNLRLVSERNTAVWESFQYPNNMWLPGQSLLMNERMIISTKSRYNLANGSFYLRPTNGALGAYVFADPPQQYKQIFEFDNSNVSESFGIMSMRRSGNFISYEAYTEDFQYIRLESDGHLNLFQFIDGYNETLSSDLLKDEKYGGCQYPLVCGKYGVCNRGKCTCPGEGRENGLFFRPVNLTEPSLGCEQVTPLTSCSDTQLQTFLELENTTYFRFQPTFPSVTTDFCKDSCLRNCSCKAALFRYRDQITRGNCSLLYDVFTLTDMATSDFRYDAITFIKVPMHKRKREQYQLVILLPALLVATVLLLGTSYCFFMWRKKHSLKAHDTDMEGDGSSVLVSPLLKIFPFEELRLATHNFQVVLGEGGYGSVYEGTTENGTKIAVKRLKHCQKIEFLAEVKTIGSIHHFNLVRLIGHCADSSNRLLVYEYMSNGSLDKWIFKRNQAEPLNWEIRRQIIVGIAKGLEYLHVHCNPNIIHFDIKPQNILLDQEFNAKIADFGLAKWISRDQSNTSTMPKGTPGYIAPELIAGRNVSVKVDVYSFGIVMLEIVCGRKNSTLVQNEHLIDELKRKAEENRVSDIIDSRVKELQSHTDEAVKFLEIAIHCLQPFNRRPSMSTVVKLLEGGTDLEAVTNYNFLTMFYPGSVQEENHDSSTPLVDSVLSGAR